MQAIVLDRFGPPEVLVPRDMPDPVAGVGQAVVDVAFAGVTFVETQVRAGRPPNPAMRPSLPVIPGNGVGGVVREVGPGVDGGLVGKRVVTTTGGSGGYAARVAVDASRLIAVPDGLGTDDAVALLADGRTALHLMGAVGIAWGETVLIEPAGGGVGTVLVQLARNAGADVVAAAGDDEKLALVRALGAARTVNYRKPAWPELLRVEAPGVDVAFDGVGGAIGLGAFAAVRGGGRFISFGMASGAFAAVTDAHADRRGIRLVRPSPPTPQASDDLTSTVLAEAAAGRLRPIVGQRFALRDAARAHAAIEARTTIGKTILVVHGAGV